MKVTGVRTTVVGAPWRDLVFVEVETDTGLVGASEVRMVNKTETLLACIKELSGRHLVGSDPFDVERLAWNVQWGEYGRAGEVSQSTLAAFEVACWDLIGQELGVPVWKLLGGCFRDRVPAYANAWYQAEREPSAIAELATAAVARGYAALKLDPFGAASAELPAPELRRSIAIVEAVRRAVGPDVQLMIEMHGRFTPSTACRVAAELEAYDPEWIEEPVPPYNPTALRTVRDATRLPIATGERVHTLPEFHELIVGGLVDVIQADLTHFGGFLAMKRLAGWADAYHLMIAPHNVCGPVGTAANLQLAVSTSNYKVLEHFNDFADPWVRDLVDKAPTVDPADGCFAAPERPGLGVRLDHDACFEHPSSGAWLRLFHPGWERRERPAESTGPA